MEQLYRRSLNQLLFRRPHLKTATLTARPDVQIVLSASFNKALPLLSVRTGIWKRPVLKRRGTLMPLVNLRPRL